MSARGGRKPRGLGAGLVSGMGSAGHYAGVMWKPTNQNELAVSVIWAGKIGELPLSHPHARMKHNRYGYGML